MEVLWYPLEQALRLRRPGFCLVWLGRSLVSFGQFYGLQMDERSEAFLVAVDSLLMPNVGRFSYTADDGFIHVVFRPKRRS